MSDPTGDALRAKASADVQELLQRIWRYNAVKVGNLDFELLVIAVPRYPANIEAVSSVDRDDIIPLLEAFIASQKQPEFRHIKTGGLYMMVGHGRIQAEEPLLDMEPVTIYRSAKDGSLWARHPDEFNDGRFESLSSLPVDAPPATE